jgi:hypothetical protein
MQRILVVEDEPTIATGLHVTWNWRVMPSKSSTTATLQ